MKGRNQKSLVHEMKTLEKQQKRGYYSITIGYENVVYQHILGSFDKIGDIPTSSQKQLQKEYAPGVDTMKVISGFAGIRFVDNIYREHKNQVIDAAYALKDKANEMKTGSSYAAHLMSKIMPALAKVSKKAEYMFNLQENQLVSYHDMLYAFLYMKQFSSLEGIICGPSIPFYFMRRLDKYGFQKINHLFKGKKDTVNEQMKWVFFSQFMQWMYKYRRSMFEGLLKVMTVTAVRQGVQMSVAGATGLTLGPAGWATFVATMLVNSISLSSFGKITKDKVKIGNRKEFYQEYDFETMKPALATTSKAYFGNLGLDFLVNPFSTLDNLFDGFINYFERWHTSVTQSIALYGSLLAGTVLLRAVVCKKFVNNRFVLDVDKQKFNGFLKKVIALTSEKFIVMDEFEKKLYKKTPVSLIKINISNKVYENNNDVSDQIHLQIKELLKNLPENVFVYKVEYLGLEEDEAVVALNLNDDVPTNNTSNASKRNKNNSGPFDVVQTLYSIDGRTDYDKHEITSVDKHVIRYVDQFNQLYMFKNRKTFVRKYLFNAVSNLVFKPPKRISPSIPKYYTFYFQNTTDESFKLYFYDVNRPWMTHAQTIQHVQNKNKNKNKSSSGDIYVINIYLKKFVEKNLVNILADIPKELEIIKVTRPPVENNSGDCEHFQIYPIDKNEACFIPQKYTTDVDTLFQKTLVLMLMPRHT